MKLGPQLMAQVPKQQQQLVPGVGQTCKVSRAKRQPVMARLAGQHLVLLLHTQQLPLNKLPAESGLLEAAYQAGLDQEHALAQRTNSAQVLRALLSSYMGRAGELTCSLLTGLPELGCAGEGERGVLAARA